MHVAAIGADRAIGDAIDELDVEENVANGLREAAIPTLCSLKELVRS